MNRILVPVDLSQAMDAVLEVGEEAARAYGCRVTLLHVLHTVTPMVASDMGPGVTPMLAVSIVQADWDRSRRELGTIAHRWKEAGVDAETEIVEGDPAEVIVEQAKELGAGLIVIGSHGHGALYHLLLGSVSNGVMRHAPCPVMVVPIRKPAGAKEARQDVSAGK